eukprot:gnl/MRDRNA2_/MRDRNA2_42572_c0_seq1.p2 gnl/MRDRNA2_/MRDRNA2_42572_c0~~gnl/MRDRNA2_/MRDRNA2_42572_c0_seq1.p2  ORF type:complete len:105 (-),score=20.52 gnl/MRDRNA2_/MRDRNA2_42572_c0_seq1:67-381(-)
MMATTMAMGDSDASTSSASGSGTHLLHEGTEGLERIIPVPGGPNIERTIWDRFPVPGGPNVSNQTEPLPVKVAAPEELWELAWDSVTAEENGPLQDLYEKAQYI